MELVCSFNFSGTFVTNTSNLFHVDCSGLHEENVQICGFVVVLERDFTTNLCRNSKASMESKYNFVAFLPIAKALALEQMAKNGQT